MLGHEQAEDEHAGEDVERPAGEALALGGRRLAGSPGCCGRAIDRDAGRTAAG